MTFPAQFVDAITDDHGLIYTDTFVTRGGDPHDLIELARRRVLTRIRSGSYVPTHHWRELDDAAQHRLRVRATLRATGPGYAAASASAAAVWGLPVLEPLPDIVTLLGPFRGGGRSDPRVHKITRAFASARVVEHDGVRVTDPVRTAADLAVESGFVAGLMAFDAVLRQSLGTREDFAAFLAACGFRTGRAVVAEAIRWSCADAESPGESAARAVFLLAGLDAPVLQWEVSIDGRVIRVDFFWPSADVAVEFDGKVKYQNPDYTHGDPSEVVWQEKLREDLLRREVRHVLRMTWADIQDPTVIVRRLLAAGVPRR